MDTEGFLPITLIASFHRVQALTTDVGLIIKVRDNLSTWLPMYLDVLSFHFWLYHIISFRLALKTYSIVTKPVGAVRRILTKSFLRKMLGLRDCTVPNWGWGEADGVKGSE
uniref:HTH La-type RNA-binding domain-containing protein n=1 Tax=Micrurus lemniscatus lemniscatus TaxID=129467 RepID=A0A2D4I1L2_MICLE